MHYKTPFWLFGILLLIYSCTDNTPKQTTSPDHLWDKTACQKAFEYINSVRANYKRTPLIWDERLSALAYERSKDMHDRNYFDHVTPDGKSIKDLQATASISSYYNLAENIHETINHTEDCQHAVDEWLTSRGHRYNLLYPKHTSGALACYQTTCTFLGMNTGTASLGAGTTSTGEEGLHYWKTAPAQPYEV